MSLLVHLPATYVLYILLPRKHSISHHSPYISQSYTTSFNFSIVNTRIAMAAASATMQSCIASPIARSALSKNHNTLVSFPFKRDMSVRCQAEEKQSPETQASTSMQPKAQKVSKKFGDVLAFSGPAPERINGRLAMLGFVAALGAELASGSDLSSQIMNGGVPSFVIAATLFSAASLIPLFKGVSVQSKSSGLWTADAEMLNGRFAMLGLVALAFTEYVTGGPLV